VFAGSHDNSGKKIDFLKLLMVGHPKSPYAGGTFEMFLEIPSNYPYKAPTLRFLTPIYHYAVSNDGKLCLPLLLDKWSPASNIQTILEETTMLIMESKLYDPNGELSQRAWLSELMRVDPAKYYENAKEATATSASKNIEVMVKEITQTNPDAFSSQHNLVAQFQQQQNVDDEDDEDDEELVLSNLGCSMYAAINSGKVPMFDSITISEQESGNNQKRNKKTVIQVSSDVPAQMLGRVLEFLYTGLVSVTSRKDNVKEMMKIANKFQCQDLVTIGQNILSNQADLNPSIGTFLNDKSGQVAKSAFFLQNRLADTKLAISDNANLPVHRALLKCRSSVMKFLVDEAVHQDELVSLKEAIKLDKTLSEESKIDQAIRAVIEFFYTDHAPIAECDPIILLQVANQLGASRLVSLCELYLTKVIDRSVTTQIEKSDFDVVGLLNIAHQNNAPQLVTFCLHFISTNFGPMSKRPEFKNLNKADLDHVTKHQWPPLDYLKELEEYEKAVAQQRKGSSIFSAVSSFFGIARAQ
jgi:ubiquitin-protein ligase